MFVGTKRENIQRSKILVSKRVCTYVIFYYFLMNHVENLLVRVFFFWTRTGLLTGKCRPWVTTLFQKYNSMVEFFHRRGIFVFYFRVVSWCYFVLFFVFRAWNIFTMFHDNLLVFFLFSFLAQIWGLGAIWRLGAVFQTFRNSVGTGVMLSK